MSHDAFDSLKMSVNSEESGLATSSDSRAGLVEDEFTIALSKYASKNIKCVTNALKQLIDMKKPDSSAKEAEKAKSVDDLIEEKILAIAKENCKDEEFGKKKK